MSRAGLAVATVAGHIEIARLALVGRAAMAALKSETIESALGAIKSGRLSAPVAPKPIEASKQCASCEGNNPALAMFCTWCGTAYDADTPAPAEKPAANPASMLSARDVRRIRAAGLDPDVVAAVARQQMRGAVLTTNSNPSKLSIATQLRARNAGIDPAVLEAQARLNQGGRR